MTERTFAPDPVAAIALLDEPMRRRLYDFVADRGGAVSRDQASAALGISRELAGFHLDRLAAGGLLETEYRRLGVRQGRGGGRPAKLYRRARHDVTVSIPARDYAQAATDFAEALSHLDDRAAQAAVQEVAHARGEAQGRTARKLAGRRPSHRRLEGELVRQLTDEGYEPLVEASGSIRLRNCPYHALAQSHRQLSCGMNLAWAKGVVDGLGDKRLDAEPSPTDTGECCVIFERHQ